jgi:hypothetical protein
MEQRMRFKTEKHTNKSKGIFEIVAKPTMLYLVFVAIRSFFKAIKTI